MGETIAMSWTAKNALGRRWRTNTIDGRTRGDQTTTAHGLDEEYDSLDSTYATVLETAAGDTRVDELEVADARDNQSTRA